MANKDKIEKLEDLIKDTIEGELVEQKVTSLLPPGENYGSVMYKVDFKVKKDGKEREYHAVAKCTPPNQVTQEIFNTQETFKSEIAWYTTVIPTFKKFAKEQGMEREIDFFQTFYGARISLDPNSDKVDLDGVILTENLKYLGYYNVDRHQGFDAETAINVLKDLACFHAIPLAIRLKDPELFKKKVNIVCGKFAEPDEKFTGKMDQDLLTVFEHIPEFEPYMDRIRKGVKESKQFGPREIREPWATVIHMDFWCNNIMVTGGTNSKTIILDLQVTAIGSPVCDLTFFLMTSVQLNVIKDKYDEFVKFYYDEFIKNLKALKVDTNNYDFEGFLKEMDIEMKKSEFAHVLAFNQIIQMEKGITTFDSSDASGSYDQMENKTIPINHRQIEKFRWITSEAIKSNWI